MKIESKDLKIGIKTGSNQNPVVYSQPQTIISPPQSVTNIESNLDAGNEKEIVSEESNLITIKSPIIGTFYRKAAPDKPAFVEVGDTIKEGGVLCVIEAMKLFNEIESEVSGTIVKILIDDATPVEFDQPLFLINPS